MKTCSKCEESKPFSEFYRRNRSHGDGYQGYCRSCSRHLKTTRYRDKGLAYSREYRASVTQPCAVVGCENLASSQTEGSKCNMHSIRLRKHGEVGPAHQVRVVPDSELTYKGAHQRVYGARGRAAEHTCADCGEQQAAEWSYGGGSDRELTQWGQTQKRLPVLLTYSPDPDDYDPRCVPCHREYDRNNKSKNEKKAA